MNVAQALRRLHLQARHEPDEATLLALLVDLLSQLDPQECRAVIRHSYWRLPEIPTGILEEATGGADALLAAAGRGPIEGECSRCGQPLRALTRDQHPPPVCRPCTAVPSTDQGRRREPVVRAPPTAWEYEPPPVPHRSSEVTVLLADRRRWAEDYPDNVVA
ncbi:hypothetical protein [Euzebya tangerina]|uniref:hypothetical protein n=1 Tax=Euzebya tangerina TaxID=591198 RepID=UPI000E321D1B|nr:hypothetical protein [Euzebya tangerina]